MIKSGHPSMRFHLLSTVVTLIVALASCQWNKVNLQEEPIIQVDTIKISTKEFADRLAHQLSKYDALTAKDPKIVRQIKKTLVDDFILSAVLQTWAQKQNLSINKIDLDAELKRVRSGFPDDFAFREELTKQGLSVGQWQKNVERQLLEKMVFDQLEREVKDPTEDEIVDYYNKNRSHYKLGERIYLQQIVLANNADANRIKAALKGTKNFGELAKSFSITPESQNEGIVGWIEKGTLEIFDQAFALPLGKISDIIQSPYGYHIMMVTKKESAGGGSLTSSRPDIKRIIRSQKSQKKFSQWLEDQLRSAHVFKDQGTIDKMSIETRKD